MKAACLKAFEEKVRSRAVFIAAEWLLPEGQRHSRGGGEGRWIAVADFLEPQVREIVEPLLGRGDCWMQRFGPA